MLLAYNNEYFSEKCEISYFLTKYRISAQNRTCLTVRELREFSNFAKTRVRMYSFHMLHFNVLFTSGLTCRDNILLRIITKLIFLNLNPSARQILFLVRYRNSDNSIKKTIPS